MSSQDQTETRRLELEITPEAYDLLLHLARTQQTTTANAARRLLETWIDQQIETNPPPAGYLEPAPVWTEY